MRIDVSVEVKPNIAGATALVARAAEGALLEVSTKIDRDIIDGSPWKTGHNARSIRMEVSGLIAEFYSTSGYGGYLETGTVNMNARPYFRPALDRNTGQGQLQEAMRKRLQPA